MFHNPAVTIYQGIYRLASVQRLCMEAFPLAENLDQGKGTEEAGHVTGKLG